MSLNTVERQRIEEIKTKTIGWDRHADGTRAVHDLIRTVERQETLHRATVANFKAQHSQATDKIKALENEVIRLNNLIGCAVTEGKERAEDIVFLTRGLRKTNVPTIKQTLEVTIEPVEDEDTEDEDTEDGCGRTGDGNK